MDILKQLNGGVQYLEQNLCGEIDVDKAARIACMPKDSFLRFFSYMTGMTVAQYIRRRRLTLAAADLQRTGARVIDTAVKYGYESADAFSRAFSRQHGVTPALARQRACPLQIYPPVSFTILVKGARKMDFRIIDIADLTVCGISKAFGGDGPREALRSELWSEAAYNAPGQICQGQWNEPGNTSYDGVWYGVWQDGRYLVAREKALTQKPGLEELVVPGGRYAAFTTGRGGLAWEEFPKLWETVLGSWLPDSGYRLRSETVIEVYHMWTDHEQRRKNRYYELWVPVEETARDPRP